jgi:hypothetical protein
VTYDLDLAYDLLPAVYRLRDADLRHAAGPDLPPDVQVVEPLRAFLAVLAEQAAVLEENLRQLYDDQFVETCAEWVVPYIGDLVGARGIYTPPGSGLSQRAEVANTLRYRRRKGTVAVLEELAANVTRWPAHAVEFFQRLVTTQYMNHVRLGNLAWVDLRDREALERLGGPLETSNHTLEVRRIASGRGRYAIPNVGIFLWRIGAHTATRWRPFKVDARRYTFSPLGQPLRLYNRVETEAQIEHLSERPNVPQPFTRRELAQGLPLYYGRDEDGELLSLLVEVNGRELRADEIVVCNLESTGTGTWAHFPRDTYAIDPVLGRLALPSSVEATPSKPDVRVTFCYGFGHDIGGGEYARAAELDAGLLPVVGVSGGGGALGTALGATGGGSVQISDSDAYKLAGGASPVLTVGQGRRLEVRAADERRPLVRLAANAVLAGEDESELTIDGLLFVGAALVVDGRFNRVVLRNCTLVPGLDLNADGGPKSAGAPSLVIASEDVRVEIERCILGGIRVVRGSSVAIGDSIVDANDSTNVAYAAPDGKDPDPGGPLTVSNSTLVGRVRTDSISLATNSIFLADPAAAAPWDVPVRSERRQEGCVRFSWLDPAARVPRRFSCRPGAGDDPDSMRPQFVSLRYGTEAYGQLSLRTPAEIREGADDQSEMGAFHGVYQPQRERNLRLRLDEYLRFGLEAGIFYAS